jgi:hypothetical protein
MLDIDLQKRLNQAPSLKARARPRLTSLQFAAVLIVVALCSATVGIASYAGLTRPAALPSDDLGKLVVLVSEETTAVPADTWAAMERHVGKPVAEFTSADQLKAVSFLLELISEHPKETINIW